MRMDTNYRQLMRHFDPKNANVRQHYVAELHGLTNKKCADFSAVVSRISFIERIVKEMIEVCGEGPKDHTLADVFAPSLDVSSNNELATVRKADGQLYDPTSYRDLKEYVRERQAREMIIAPIRPRKMDVSTVAKKQQPLNWQEDWGTDAASWPDPWVQADANAGLQANQWNWPSPGPWTEVPAADSLALDAFGKGGKGKGGKGYGGKTGGKGKDRGPLICNNCLGEGHPWRICPSVEGAKGKGGQPCGVCNGKGHGTSQCTSKGGGKFVPKEQREKGKGKGGKQSQFFYGKGSGQVSSFGELTYSDAEWYAWTGQQQQQQQPQHQHTQQCQPGWTQQPGLATSVDAQSSAASSSGSISAIAPWYTGVMGCTTVAQPQNNTIGPISSFGMSSNAPEGGFPQQRIGGFYSLPLKDPCANSCAISDFIVSNVSRNQRRTERRAERRRQEYDDDVAMQGAIECQDSSMSNPDEFETLLIIAWSDRGNNGGDWGSREWLNWKSQYGGVEDLKSYLRRREIDFEPDSDFEPPTAMPRASAIRRRPLCSQRPDLESPNIQLTQESVPEVFACSEMGLNREGWLSSEELVPIGKDVIEGFKTGFAFEPRTDNFAIPKAAKEKLAQETAIDAITDRNRDTDVGMVADIDVKVATPIAKERYRFMGGYSRKIGGSGCLANCDCDFEAETKPSVKKEPLKERLLVNTVSAKIETQMDGGVLAKSSIKQTKKTRFDLPTAMTTHWPPLSPQLREAMTTTCDDTSSPQLEEAMTTSPQLKEAMMTNKCVSFDVESTESRSRRPYESWDAYHAEHPLGMYSSATDKSLSTLTLREKAGSLIAVTPPGWQEIEITVDSGACDPVMPEGMCPQICLVSSAYSKQGYEYEVANGAGLPNLGEKRCLMMTEDSSMMKKVVFQCADVHKALLSVSHVADLGYDCTLSKGGGYLKDTMTGDVVPLHRRGNLYFMRAWVKADSGVDPSAPFGRPE